MIPANFQYQRANSLSEAISLLGEHGEGAKLLAGGHSLIPAMKLRLNQPETLIDIGRIPELRYIKDAGDHIAIGAGATHEDLANSALLQSTLSMYCEAAGLIGDSQVRNKGTIGGSLAHADPAADWPAVILASNAAIVLQSAGGTRVVSAADFFTGFYETAIEANEILTEVRVPKPAAGTRSVYLKFMQPASRFAIVGCAAMVKVSNGTIESVSVGLTGVSDAAYRASATEAALKGQAADGEQIAAAAQKATEGRMIMSDHFASEEYRAHLARVFTERALLAAAT